MGGEGGMGPGPDLRDMALRGMGPSLDPRSAEPGDVWATAAPAEPQAFLHDPDPSVVAGGDPYPWMQIWPVITGEHWPARWRRTRDLPAGLRRIVHRGQETRLGMPR